MQYNDWAWPKKRKYMTVCAITALEAQGYNLKKVPGRGLSSIWTYENGEDKGRLAIRTSQDTWFAFPRHSGGWKTLDSVDKVVVASVDNHDTSFLEDIEPLSNAAPDTSIVDILDAAKLSISKRLGVPKSQVILEMRLGM